MTRADVDPIGVPPRTVQFVPDHVPGYSTVPATPEMVSARLQGPASPLTLVVVVVVVAGLHEWPDAELSGIS